MTLISRSWRTNAYQPVRVRLFVIANVSGIESLHHQVSAHSLPDATISTKVENFVKTDAAVTEADLVKLSNMDLPAKTKLAVYDFLQLYRQTYDEYTNLFFGRSGKQFANSGADTERLVTAGKLATCMRHTVENFILFFVLFYFFFSYTCLPPTSRILFTCFISLRAASTSCACGILL